MWFDWIANVGQNIVQHNGRVAPRWGGVCNSVSFRCRTKRQKIGFCMGGRSVGAEMQMMAVPMSWKRQCLLGVAEIFVAEA